MGAMTALTVSDQTLKASLEQRIAACVQQGRRAHFEIGECLDTILDRKLYRDKYSSFDDYCQLEWGFSGSVGRKAANAFRVAKVLEHSDGVSPESHWNVLYGLQPAHAERLAELPEDVQPIAWSEARESTPTPTVRALEEVVARHKDRLAELSNMTASEESEFNEVVERESVAAVAAARARELADLSIHRLQSVRKAIPVALAERFRVAADHIESAILEFEKEL